MDFMVDQQPIFKHFCKVCKKGFGCGRALGGHMRAHGIADESGGNLDDENPSNDWEGGNVPPNNKRMYALRTNPNRQKSCQCTSDHDGESFGSDGEKDVDRRGVGSGWSKRKRSLRLMVDNDSNTNNCLMSEEEDLANCLMMLSNVASADVALLADTPEESCASASREDQSEQRNNLTFVTPISYKPPHIDQKAKGVAQGLFECKACKKVFSSHQALGGHRASHKKVKGCFATRLDRPYHHKLDEDVITHEEFLLPSKYASKRKSKVHECSICHRIFSSGQALGGHKRCHWITSNNVHQTTPHHQVPNFQQCNNHPIEQDISHQTPVTVPKPDPLDLNLPAPSNIEIEKVQRDPQTAISFEVSTDIILQSWTSLDNKNNVKDMNMHGVDEEENSRVKITKLSDLNDMNNINDGFSSPWLQVGIGPSTDLGDGS